MTEKQNDRLLACDKRAANTESSVRGRTVLVMSVTVHGRPGGSVAESASRYGPGVASRAAGFESVVGAALEQWLTAAEGEYHLFHDLTGLAVRVSRFEERSLGGANIDHVVLAGSGLIVVNAKACGAGSLTLRQGRGALVRADGGSRPEPWLDQHRDYAVVSALARGARLDEPWVNIAWVVPDATDTSSRVLRLARCLYPPLPRARDEAAPGRGAPSWRAHLQPERPQFGPGTIVKVGELAGGVLATTWPHYFGGTTPPRGWADALAAFVSKPPRDPAQPPIPPGMVPGPDGCPVYPWDA